jgi:hypothetical protein
VALCKVLRPTPQRLNGITIMIQYVCHCARANVGISTGTILVFGITSLKTQIKVGAHLSIYDAFRL